MLGSALVLAFRLRDARLSFRGESVMAVGSVTGVRIARLERAQRLAGKSFGHEELPSLPLSGSGRWLWIAASALALIGLAALALH